MGEHDAVERVDDPVTVRSLTEDLRTLGVQPGETLLVHASLSALGWVAGGAPAVVDALQVAVTDDGNLVVPTHTGQYSDPAAWSNPSVPDDWVERVRGERPAYRPEITPTRAVGAIPECLRTYPGAVRSRHPIYSFGAWGDAAEAIVADHSFEYGLGDDSPLGAVYDRGGRVLMLGTDYDTNTSLHLAEHRANFPKTVVSAAVPILRDGERTLVECTDFETSTDDFRDVGAALESQTDVTTGTVGAADATLLDQQSLVDFATKWFGKHR
jgi:aminoglycoside 3-N-acetyltransferase